MSFTSMPRGLYSYDQLIAEGVYASYVATQYEKQCTAWVACRLKKLGSSYPYVWSASK